MTKGKPEPSPERTTGSMRYVKMFVMECLEGTIRFDFEPDERGVWYDLIILGGRMRTKGVIAAGPGKPYPRPYIAGVLNIDLELLDRTLEKCIATGRVEDNADGLRIINWPKYQSEYDRQKPYRESKKDRQKRLEEEGKCPICEASDHTKYECPSSKYAKNVRR